MDQKRSDWQLFKKTLMKKNNGKLLMGHKNFIIVVSFSYYNKYIAPWTARTREKDRKNTEGFLLLTILPIVAILLTDVFHIKGLVENNGPKQARNYLLFYYHSSTVMLIH